MAAVTTLNASTRIQQILQITAQHFLIHAEFPAQLALECARDAAFQGQSAG